MTVTMIITLFWEVTPCNLAEISIILDCVTSYIMVIASVHNW
jgi:hypothetical protein